VQTGGVWQKKQIGIDQLHALPIDRGGLEKKRSVVKRNPLTEASQKDTKMQRKMQFLSLELGNNRESEIFEEKIN
jgi:hypothetical protein